MFFAATGNIAIVGYKANMVAFESKKRRNEFVKRNSDYHSISVKEASNYDQYETCRMYPEAVFGLNKRMEGVVLFDMNGNYSSIA